MTGSSRGDDRERLALLARMTSLFASELDVDATLQGIVDLLVPDVAAWASIDVLEGAALRRVAAAARDLPGHAAIIEELRSWAPSPEHPAIARALATPRAVLVQVESPDQLSWTAPSEAHEALYAAMRPRSIIIAPLRTCGDTLGILHILASGDVPQLTADDVTLVDDVAQRASFALHTARLVAELRSELDTRRDAQHALEESEARYRRMLEGSPYPMWVFDVESLRFLTVNSAAVLQYGYSTEEFLRMSIRDIRPEEDLAGLDQSLAESRPGLRDAGIFRHRRRDGSTLLAEIRSHDVEFDGRRARVVQALDVTDRVRAHHALRVAEERHRLVSRVTKEAIWEWTPATGAMVWNPAFYELFRFDPADVAPTREWLESRVHRDDREQAEAAMQATLRTQQAHCERRYRFERGDGTVAMVEERAVIAWNGAVADRVVGSLADVTVQRQVSEQMAIAQRMEAVGRLAGGVAHDFNNLLTAIRGFATFALDEQLPSSRARDDIDQILQATDRAAALTRQLLAFSRRQVLQPQLVDVNESIGNLHRMLTRVLGEDVEVRTTLDRTLRAVRVDPGQLEQVIMNLVVNARDAMPQGGVLTIATAHADLDDVYAAAYLGASTGEHAMIAISDTGTGMDPATLERIFEPFFSTKARDKGTGLGLATSYGIIQQSGGHIRVESAPGIGSTFYVYLPSARDTSIALPRPPSERRIHLGGSETVLVVEDDDRVRRVSAGALERHGYRVLEARSAEQALGLFDEHGAGIDLVVSDVVLPRKSGPTLAHELRARRPDLRVIFVSGYTENEFQLSGAMASGIDLLEKPFAPETLVRLVRATLDRPSSD